MEAVDMSKPIPKKLLIHTVTYSEITKGDGWGDKFQDPVEIEFVRIEKISRYERGTTSKGTKYSHKLFVDRTHSTPFLNFKEGSKINFKEEEYEIAEVGEFYDFNPIPHHYELGLV